MQLHAQSPRCRSSQQSEMSQPQLAVDLLLAPRVESGYRSPPPDAGQQRTRGRPPGRQGLVGSSFASGDLGEHLSLRCPSSSRVGDPSLAWRALGHQG
eukprot:8952949-Heterocapsa_arctica.AAC.1